MGLKELILRGAHELGAFALARRLRRRQFLGATVLLYHRVLPAAAPADHYVALLGDPTVTQLEALVRYLKRWFRFATPAECVERWRRGLEVDPYTLLLTFDDGYLDLFENLLPLLRRCQVPATVFVTTGAVSRKPIWPQRLFSAVQTTARPTLPAFDGQAALPLGDVRQRVRAMETISARQKDFPARRWEDLIDRLCDDLGWDGRLDGERMMDWTHVEALHRSGLVTVGGHTVTHPLLERCEPDEARREVFDCADELRERLHPEFLPFSYPQGRCPPARVEALVRDAGFDCAFTGRPARNTSRTPPYRLGRRHVPAGDVARASLLLSGLRGAPPADDASATPQAAPVAPSGAGGVAA
jgi:peptidoglycan/xylan/chitin deacetylase (PgdA/CDA1 family)